MNTSRLAATIGFQPFDPWPYDDALVPDSLDWHFSRDADWQGSPRLLAKVLYRNPRRAQWAYRSDGHDQVAADVHSR